MKGVPSLSPLPQWGTTPGEGEFNLFSAPINKRFFSKELVGSAHACILG